MSKYLKSQDFTQEWGGAGSPSLPYIDGKLGVVANYAICERAYYNIGLMGAVGARQRLKKSHHFRDLWQGKAL